MKVDQATDDKLRRPLNSSVRLGSLRAALGSR